MSKQKPFQRMTTAELAEATKEFDREFVPTQPLTSEMRRELRKAKRGRPKVGEGAERVLITVERSLLKRADALAKERKVSRSELIARGLERLLKSA